MIDEGELVAYARAMATALRVLEPKTRSQVIGMLCGLDLTHAQAHAVIAKGIERRIFVEVGEHLYATHPEGLAIT